MRKCPVRSRRFDGEYTANAAEWLQIHYKITTKVGSSVPVQDRVGTVVMMKRKERFYLTGAVRRRRSHQRYLGRVPTNESGLGGLRGPNSPVHVAD